MYIFRGIAFYLLIAFDIAFMILPAKSTDRCVSYEPEIVTLEGVIHKAIAYGPPGYGRNPKTDSKETYESLTLDKALCVLQGDDQINEGETGIRQVEIVLSKSGSLAPDGKHISVTGTLFHQISAHQHTKVLIQVRNVD